MLGNSSNLVGTTSRQSFLHPVSTSLTDRMLTARETTYTITVDLQLREANLDCDHQVHLNLILAPDTTKSLVNLHPPQPFLQSFGLLCMQVEVGKTFCRAQFRRPSQYQDRPDSGRTRPVLIDYASLITSQTCPTQPGFQVRSSSTLAGAWTMPGRCTHQSWQQLPSVEGLSITF